MSFNENLLSPIIHINMSIIFELIHTRNCIIVQARFCIDLAKAVWIRIPARFAAHREDRSPITIFTVTMATLRGV